MNEEDEAFNEIERRAKQRKEAVRATINKGRTCPPCTNDCNQGRTCPARNEQEPVAWHYPDGSPDQCTTDKAYAEMEPAWTPLYDHPRTWVGLTDEEVELYWDWEDFQCGCGRGTLIAMVRDIESRLKERNT